MGALDDLCVLDLTRILGGPYCTMLLADMGADVVKVEPPGGDFVRRTPPFCESEDEPYGGYFQSVNRGKRSVELDFEDEADRSDFLGLVEEADVLVENYRTGTMEKFDLGYERLADRNPGLVYASMRGFGDPRTGESPRQEQSAFDLVVQALGGVMHLNGHPDDPPTKVALGIGDIFTGVLHAVGILAAVHYRERTGEGQFVDTAMYDSMISLCERAVYQYSYQGTVPGRRGNSHPTLFPYNAFETRDGHVVIAALDDHHWEALCRAIERPDLVETHPSPPDRLEDRDALREVIADWAARQTTEEVLDCLQGTVPCAPVQDVADVFADEHAHARDMLTEVVQPGADRTVTVAGTPIKMTETPPSPGERAPLLDEHREEVLGKSTDEDEARSASGSRPLANGGANDPGSHESPEPPE